MLCWGEWHELGGAICIVHMLDVFSNLKLISNPPVPHSDLSVIVEYLCFVSRVHTDKHSMYALYRVPYHEQLSEYSV